MPDHYYTAQPESQHKERAFSAAILGHELRFETDSGVFSRTEVDPGSRLLIEALGSAVRPGAGSGLRMGRGRHFPGHSQPAGAAGHVRRQ